MPIQTLWDKLFGRNDKSPRMLAKDRLRFVLLHDRADIPAPMMEEMRREILGVLSKYIEIDESALEVNLEKNEDAVALIATSLGSPS